MVGPGKTFVRYAVPTKEVGLPGSHTRNARNLVGFGLVRDRIRCFRRTRTDQQIHFVFKDQLRSDLRSPVGTRLAILADDLDFIAYPAVTNPFAQCSSDLVEDK